MYCIVYYRSLVRIVFRKSATTERPISVCRTDDIVIRQRKVEPTTMLKRNSAYPSKIFRKP